MKNPESCRFAKTCIDWGKKCKACCGYIMHTDEERAKILKDLTKHFRPDTTEDKEKKVEVTA